MRRLSPGTCVVYTMATVLALITVAKVIQDSTTHALPPVKCETVGKDGVRHTASDSVYRTGLGNRGRYITHWWQASALLKWEWEKPAEYTCRRVLRAGHYFICQDPPFTVKPPCLVYSFGVNSDWSFDEKMGELGCDTHSFDPSLKMNDHIHKKVVHFHKLGVGDRDNDSLAPPPHVRHAQKPNTWKMRTFRSIVNMLGHQNKVLDVVKLDVGGSEWGVLRNMLADGLLTHIRHLIVQWNLIQDFPPKSDYFELLEMYYTLKNAGFTSTALRLHSHGYTEKRWRVQAGAHYVNKEFKRNENKSV